MSDAVRVYRGGREICADTPAGRAEYRARTAAMAERQNGLCALCGLWMGDDVTFDHERSRGMAGGFREDRIEIAGRWVNAAVHFRCNGNKGSRRVPYVIVQP